MLVEYSTFTTWKQITTVGLQSSKNLVGLAIYLRNEEGVEGAKINVTGGDRDAAKNKREGGSSTSPHMAGHAADIKVPGMSNEDLAYAAANSGLFTGVIYYPQIGYTEGFGTHIERVVSFLNGSCENPIYQEMKVKNYQNLHPHVHVDNRHGTGVTRLRYAGDTSKNVADQTGKYVKWKSNNQIK